MKPTTLCFIVNENNQVLLGRKKRGFGAGKYNGFGGKKQDDETFRQCAVREIREEVSLLVDPEDLEPVAILNFQFPYDEDLNHLNYAYIVRNYKGLPLESEEMEPFWFDFDKIPYDEMWQGDKDWIPSVLEGKLLHALLVFDKANDGVLYSAFDEVSRIDEFETVEEIRACLREK